MWDMGDSASVRNTGPSCAGGVEHRRFCPVVFPPQASSSNDEIDLLQIWRVLVQGKWWIFFWVILATGSAWAVAQNMRPVYRAEVLLRSSSEEGRKTSGLLAQYGGLAAMAGVDIGGGGNSVAPLATLKSRIFAQYFIREENLLPVLFADAWDAKTGKWKVEDPSKVPTLRDGADFFNGRVRFVTEDKQTKLVTLSVEWHDRELASRWANLLVERINRHIKQQAIQDAEKSIAYLKEEMSKTQFSELRSMLASLLESQFQQVMLANVRDDFAFKVVDPAVVPPEGGFVRPRKRLIVMVGLIAGTMAGVFFALVGDSLRRRREKRRNASDLDGSFQGV